jgi:hypothetical protein
MYRTCNGCKALEVGIGRQQTASCQLGHQIQGDKKYDRIILSYKPMEDCLKPKTMSDLIYLYDSMTKNIIK